MMSAQNSQIFYRLFAVFAKGHNMMHLTITGAIILQERVATAAAQTERAINRTCLLDPPTVAGVNLNQVFFFFGCPFELANYRLDLWLNLAR